MADGNFPATDGTAYARRFVGHHKHHQVPDAGHNLPQEAPAAFADAVLEVARLAAPPSPAPDAGRADRQDQAPAAEAARR
jgi:hypothetical protein